MLVFVKKARRAGINRFLLLEVLTYLFLISQILSLQITNFFESTLHDIFVYKEGAFTYFSAKCMFFQVDDINKFSYSMIFKYF